MKIVKYKVLITQPSFIIIQLLGHPSYIMCFFLGDHLKSWSNFSNPLKHTFVKNTCAILQSLKPMHSDFKIFEMGIIVLSISLCLYVSRFTYLSYKKEKIWKSVFKHDILKSTQEVDKTWRQIISEKKQEAKRLKKKTENTWWSRWKVKKETKKKIHNLLLMK